MHQFGVIFRMDLDSSLRSKWFWFYSAVLLCAIAGIFASSVTDSRVMGFTGLTRLLVIFIQATNLILPVFILVTTVRTLVKERETCVFEYLLSYPVSLAEYYWGKALGRFVTVTVPLVAAMAVSVAVCLAGGKPVDWRVVAVYSALMAASAFFWVGMSFLISAVVKTQEAGLGIALFVWLTLIAFLDIVLLGFLIQAAVPENAIYALVLANPIQIFKIAAISLFDPILSVIGPAAYFILDLFGPGRFLAYALGYMTVLGAVFLALGFKFFAARDLL